MIIDYVNSFWAWAEIPEPRRGADISRLPVDPFEFPLLTEMQATCISKINTMLSATELDAFLMCMAIDSECECILAACAKTANATFLEALIPRGIHYPQYETRWQMAELLRKDIPRADQYLRVLLSDAHPYVRKRAQNVFLSLFGKEPIV